MILLINIWLKINVLKIKKKSNKNEFILGIIINY